MKRHIRFTCGIAVYCVLYLLACPLLFAVAEDGVLRERLLMDSGWRFALGHAYDTQKDFYHGTGFFSYFAKTGNGDGAAAGSFDDREWRMLDLPHDWAVEMPFDERGSGSHGFKAVGRNFPESSVGWYRKTFFVPESDLGRRISIEFDGVFRDSRVWVNGHFLGNESSGYTSFSYDLTEFLTYGGNNVIAVRVDATMEEGWFYEGAGIYRHVWLAKTAPLHVARWGTFVSSEVKGKSAEVTARVTIANDAATETMFKIYQAILDSDGKTVAKGQSRKYSLKAGDKNEFASVLKVSKAKLWSCETPTLYKLVTTVTCGGKEVDRYETPFGIRTIRWDANEGFFLNGKRVQIKGVCNHQDHAGVGVAIPDSLNEFRVLQVKKMGANAIRTSHNPPAPELLDICDRLGVLVMDENREYGINAHQLNQLERLILRDRNHPCIVIWCIGNEEWGVEGNEKGTRVTQAMQNFAKRLDPTRPVTVAISGGWGKGSSVSIDVMGFNYFTHGDSDKYHAQFPDKPSVGSEDGSTLSTRGIYVEDREHQHLTAYDRNKTDWSVLAEESWNHFAARPFIAGQFQWTGFDYRGEPTPFGWPAIGTQFGIMDQCGFPKDNFYYYQAWWSDKPVLHLLPHWNWQGREGQEISVWVHSNCQKVELFLNDKSLGRQTMKKNSHLEWNVKYEPGVLLARGFNDGREILTDKVETAGAPAAVQLTADRTSIDADGRDVSVIAVQVNDEQGRIVPTAGNEITFAIDGPGKIIGVGNGDPSCHEPDVFLEKFSSRVAAVNAWKWTLISNPRGEAIAQIAAEFDDSDWRQYDVDSESGPLEGGKCGVFRSWVTITQEDLASDFISLSFGMIDDDGWIYINGKKAGESHNRQIGLVLDIKDLLHEGNNTIAVVVANNAGEGGLNNGVKIQFRGKPIPAQWKRSVFNGLGQVIVQSTEEAGQITLTAESGTSASLNTGGLKSGRVVIETRK